MAVHTVVPSPQVPQVVSFPSTQEQITQAQLERIIALRNQAAALKADLESEEAEVKAELEAGVPIESGTHVASLKEGFRRTISWRDVAVRLAERLYGDGRGHAYAENVLQNTKPSNVVSLVVS